MKKFEEFFPELKSTTNHAIVILEEAFNKYYEQLASEEDRKKLISDFANLIKTSKIEKIGNVKVPLLIEDEKYYFIDDYFYRDYAKKVSTILEEIDKGGNPLQDEEADAIFGNDEVVEIIDDTQIENDSTSFAHPEELTPETLQSSTSTATGTEDNNIAFSSIPADVSQEATDDNDDVFSPFSPSIQNPDIKEDTLKQEEQKTEAPQESAPATDISQEEEQCRKAEQESDITEESGEEKKDDTETEDDKSGTEIDEGHGVLVFNKRIDTEKLKNDLLSILKKDKKKE